MINNFEDIYKASKPEKNLNFAHSFWHSLVSGVLLDNNRRLIEYYYSQLSYHFNLPHLPHLPTSNRDSYKERNSLIPLEIITPPQRDGNPILNCFLPIQQRSIRIINLSSQSDFLQLSTWTDKSFRRHVTGELVIALELNKTSYQLSIILIYLWISLKPTNKEMEYFLDEFWSKLVQEKSKDISYFN
ncbi:hypothetical protein [Enterobacter asburiae]|uniref:hypothetical protein n=1 Tax=Enterobacter asburiae TaxID=61645 RepID=UPI002074CCCB|nr:hypothetical protein [Enterobacter asburiae]MCM7565671.1 hypothetical protein [Enterobacter asburiae]